MRVRILNTTVAEKRIVRAGEIVDLQQGEANMLIGIKQAESAELNNESVSQTREMLTETKLGQPAKRGRKKKELIT